MSREIFNEQIKKAEKLSHYNKSRASRLLDDLATAYISQDFNTLDKSFYAVKSARKSLSSAGYTLAEIDDYLLQYSYITKTQINKLRNQSIYLNDSISIAPHIENIQDKETKIKETDLIIDTLKSNKKLLRALQKNTRQDHISEKFKISNPVLLKQFYEQHKSIID